jgi:DoxX-like protein
VELTTAKVLGLLALQIPQVPRKVKEFAYFGFGITLISAAFVHYSVGDATNLSVLFVLDPLFFLCALVVSYVYFERRNTER